MSIKSFCPQCLCYHGECGCIQEPIFDNQQLYNDLQALHRNCDPCDMTYEDQLIWEKWNKVFNP